MVVRGAPGIAGAINCPGNVMIARSTASIAGFTAGLSARCLSSSGRRVAAHPDPSAHYAPPSWA